MGNKASKQQAGAQSGDAPQNGPKPSVAGAKGSSGSLFKRGKSEKVYTESVTLVSPRVWAERRPEKPNEHLTDVGRADGVVYAASAIRGDRKYMEDTHSVVLGMEHPRPPPPPPPQPNSNLGGRRRSILSVFTGSSEDGATSPAPSHGRRGSILRFLGSHDSNHDNSTSNPPSHANPLASPSTGSSNDGIAHHPQPRRKSIWQALHMTSMDSVERARSPSAISITLSSQITRPTSRASGHSEHVDAEERTMTPDQTYPQRRASRTRRKSILDVITSPFRRSSTALSERRGSFAPSESELQLPSHFSYFAVFDGHAGKEAAEFCAEKMHDVLTKQLSFARGDYVSAIREGFMAMDGELRSELQKDPANTVNAGTCATVALVIPAIGSLGPRLAIGNVGDARGIMVSAGTAERITVDHEPSLDSEKARIKAAGGYVDEDGRVNGYIMVSRSLGDFSGKSNPRLPSESQLISNEPTVSIRNLGEADEMAILASDGIWGVYVGDQDVANFVLGRIWRGVAIPKILEELLETIYLLTKGTSRCDNKTVMIVAFVKPNETEADWIARVQRTMRARLPPGHENWEARDGVNHEGLLTCELTAKKPGLGFKKKTGEVKP